MTELGLAIGVVLSLAIGANNAGAAMAPAYGARVLGRWSALALFAVFAALGAATLGRTVLRSVGTELLAAAPPDSWALLVLGPTVALFVIATATALRVPFPTTPAAVSALVGIGFYYDLLRNREVMEILAWWIVSPLAAIGATFALKRLAIPGDRRLLIALGAYSAFAIGANNGVNAFAPLVTAGALDVPAAAALAAAGFAVGSLAGGGVLHTLGREVADLDAKRALVVGFVGATALLAASLDGVPISGAVCTSAAVFAYARSTRPVRKIVVLWATGPAFAASASYALAWGFR